MEFLSFLALAIFVVVVGKIGQLLLKKDTQQNPFLYDASQAIKPLVINQNERDKVLKQSFKIDKVPAVLDAIVIGSGIGGLSTAAILAKSGKKVLVLEQHDQAGGCCHSYIEKGYEFDVGIHYIGGMHYQSISKTFLDQISDGQIQWEPLSDNFDTVVFSGENGDSTHYPIYANQEVQKKNLKALFPNEENGIDKYYELSNDVANQAKNSVIVKFLPLWLVKILTQVGLINLMSSYFKWNERTVRSVADELTTDQKLRDIFCYCFGDYGTLPTKSGFPMQAMLTSHFSKGASYPIGGASQIAHSIIPVIEREGGKVLVRAEVIEILVNSDKKAEGVKVRQGKQEHTIFAPLVISNAGVYNTFEKLLPSEIATQSRLFPFVKTQHGVGFISVFVGFDASAEDLDIPHKRNFWIFNHTDIDKAAVEYLSLSKEKCEDATIPLMFISFPSTKDPTWEKRYPGKTSLTAITTVNYDWFKEWEKAPCQKRGDDYEAMKKTLGYKIIGQVCDMFPKLKDHVDYVKIGTPLSNNFYLGSTKGEIYGLDHTQSRFSPMNQALLRPTTDIPGLFLTGQDVFSCGFVGALWGGLLCAQQVLGRNIMKDLTKLHKKNKLQVKED